jgi:hypothetical protein
VAVAPSLLVASVAALRGSAALAAELDAARSDAVLRPSVARKLNSRITELEGQLEALRSDKAVVALERKARPHVLQCSPPACLPACLPAQRMLPPPVSPHPRPPPHPPPRWPSWKLNCAPATPRRTSRSKEPCLTWSAATAPTLRLTQQWQPSGRMLVHCWCACRLMQLHPSVHTVYVCMCMCAFMCVCAQPAHVFHDPHRLLSPHLTPSASSTG